MSRAPRGAGPESCGTPCARSFFNSCESLPRRHSDAKSVVVTLPRWLTEGASQFSDDGPGVKRRGFSLGQTNSGPSGAHWGRLTTNGPLGLNGAKRLSLNHCCAVKPGTPLAARLSGGSHFSIARVALFARKIADFIILVGGYAAAVKFTDFGLSSGIGGTSFVKITLSSLRVFPLRLEACSQQRDVLLHRMSSLLILSCWKRLLISSSA